MRHDIKEMIVERNFLLTYDSDNPLIDSLSEEIWQSLKENQDKLPVEFIIESLTYLGAAPSILYDDNGHFTIGGDGFQNMPTFDDDFETKETTFEGAWIVKPGHWKHTIREAIRDYFEDSG